MARVNKIWKPVHFYCSIEANPNQIVIVMLTRWIKLVYSNDKVGAFHKVTKSDEIIYQTFWDKVYVLRAKSWPCKFMGIADYKNWKCWFSIVKNINNLIYFILVCCLRNCFQSCFAASLEQKCPHGCLYFLLFSNI